MQGVAEDGGPLVALLLPGLAPNTSNEIATGADAPNIDAIDICTMVSWQQAAFHTCFMRRLACCARWLCRSCTGA